MIRRRASQALHVTAPQQPYKKWMASFALVVAFACFSPMSNLEVVRSLSLLKTDGIVDEKTMFPNITLLEDVCPSAQYPPLYAELHDHRARVRRHYREMGNRMKTFNNYIGRNEHTDIPKLRVFDEGPSRYCVWNGNFSVGGYAHLSEASAWSVDDPTDMAEGLGWVEPMVPTPNRILHGDYVGYTSWFHDNYGHFVHDHLPTIAFLRSVLPTTTKFLLMDAKVTRNVLKFLDESFYERIEWVHPREVVEIRDGSLTVSIVNSLPTFHGCCRSMDFLRQWVAETHTDKHEPQQKSVVYYSRRGSSDVYHGRVLEEEHEREVIAHIQAKMKQHNRPERFTIFTGQADGKTMDTANQFDTFRAASTIIGPHGSGIGGNFAWTTPYASSCEERVQLLEFIPGPDSAYVQSLYASYFINWRKWPVDYNVLLYTNQSTHMSTFVDLNDLDAALDDMWGKYERTTVLRTKRK